MPKSFLIYKKNCSNKIPISNKLNSSDTKLLENLKNDLPSLIRLIDNQELNEFIKKVINYCFEANKYFNDSEPWSLKQKIKREWKLLFLQFVNKLKI